MENGVNGTGQVEQTDDTGILKEVFQIWDPLLVFTRNKLR